MTDEERQKLVSDLREFTGLDNEPWLVRVGRDAANEIERLDKALREWRSIAERLQDDLRSGTRTCDFSFLGTGAVE